jgi:LysR family transcriptional regulator, regulator for bpeEF and oprC
MDRIAAMKAFVRVVEAGNFTKAADTLGVPNPTVTRLIQGLERDLQVKLLHRTTRSVTVTPEGATYYERVLRLLAELSDIESSARLARGLPTGRVRVETAAAVGSMLIVPALAGFYRDFPDVQIELGTGNRRSDLVAEGIDCAIRVGEIDDPSIVARRLGTFRSTTCATPAFLQVHGVPQVPQDLARLPTVGLLSARSGRPLPFRYLDGAEAQELELAHKLVVNDTNSCVAAALAGLGIVQMPSYAVHEALRDGRLVPLLPGLQTPVVPIHVLYAPNRYLSAKVRVFIDWAVALFEANDSLRPA